MKCKNSGCQTRLTVKGDLLTCSSCGFSISKSVAKSVYGFDADNPRPAEIPEKVHIDRSPKGRELGY
jgi:hypothetical protein